MVSRFVTGGEAHERMDRLARKYLGSERFERIMPGELRVAVIVRPVRCGTPWGWSGSGPAAPAPPPDRTARHGRPRHRCDGRGERSAQLRRLVAARASLTSRTTRAASSGSFTTSVRFMSTTRTSLAE